MQLFPALDQDHDLPLAGDPESARAGYERLLEAARLRDEEEAMAAFAAMAENPRGKRILGAVFGNSPFLTLCAERDPAFFHALLTKGPDAVVDGVMAEVESWRREASDDATLSRNLRIAKRRIALSVALADIAGLWELERVTGALSAFAEGALKAASAHVLRALARRGALRLKDEADPERDSGLIVLAMGKLGAGELNYSSDIDLIVLFDAEVIDTEDPDELQSHFVRLTRNLVKLIDERTVDGYVFRTDLRLRPDPSSTPLAISVLAAETYYESVGQNWERAAMIKARPVAGDIEAGERFLKWLGPFMWRKYLDFATIRDVHAIKRQINAHRGGSSIAVSGHNIKLGRGGIREIEFFAQTQQLIWGGREAKLRTPATVQAITALKDHGRTTGQAASELIVAYHFLRQLEHRLQMTNDEQTQTLPTEPADLERLALFMGFTGLDDFSTTLVEHLKRVETHYAELFEDAPSLPGSETVEGNLVFTGSDSDPDTFRTLEGLGYKNPQAIDSTVRNWHHGRYRSTTAKRAREMLTELMPVLLETLAKTPDPDAAFLQFDEFISRLPAGVQLFSMMHSNPHLLELLADILGTAPRLAKHLGRNASMLDGVLSTDLTEPPPKPEELDESLDRLLVQAEVEEDVLDITRRWANDRKFQVGVQSLRGHLAPRATARALSNIAETALSRLQPRIEQIFAQRHGAFDGTGMCVIAMGKLGGREMTPASDLDMIFVYDAGDAEASDGDKPLVPSQYFARLSQRLINAVTAQTSEGTLYEVDMRLRPSGKAGPIAVSLASFDKYQHEEAWTWEHMALTRARVISGPPELREKVKAIIADVLERPKDVDKLLRDVADMRRRMDKEHHTEQLWEVKQLRGGLVDIEFLSQYLQLRHAPEHPDVAHPNTRTALRNLQRAGCIEDGVAARLMAALDLWQAVQGMLRLTIRGYFEENREDEVPTALKETLARLGDCPDFSGLKDKMRDTAADIHGLFREIIEEPAASLPPLPDDEETRA